MEVMSIDELTVEASVRLLHVLDAPAVTSGGEAEEADEGDEEIIDASDDSAEGEAEAQAEAELDGAAAADDADADNSDDSASDAAADQHIAEPGR
jgi:exoribonuclease-2